MYQYQIELMKEKLVRENQIDNYPSLMTHDRWRRSRGGAISIGQVKQGE